MNNLSVEFLILLLATMAVNDFITNKFIKNETHTMIFSIVKLLLGLAVLVTVYNVKNDLVYRIGWGFIPGLAFTFPRFKKKNNITGH
jgi:uncharacterized membrane protein